MLFLYVVYILDMVKSDECIVTRVKLLIHFDFLILLDSRLEKP